ncbi:MAG: helix-turn-helix transcriptional regulator [Christensenellaceae bacterium]|nr:helix-turn-helix transcriptional regulator [Christensenellaceae bacterium]
MEQGFGQRLIHAMELRGMRQKELARTTGVTEATVSRYVNEKRCPDIDFIREVVRVLKVSADYLLGFTDDMRTAEERAGSALLDEEGKGIRYAIISQKDGQLVAVTDKEQEELLDNFFTLLKNK